MIISSTTISPLSPKRSGVGATPLISTMKHEWYFNNVQNASADIITIPDTGSVGGLNLSNPALANKPTASTIGGKISEAADGVDDYLYKATTNFMKSMPTWMVSIVFKYDSSSFNTFLSASNTDNVNNEGWHIGYNDVVQRFQTTSNDSSGTQFIQRSNAQALVDGQDYIVTFGWNGYNFVWFLEATNIGIVPGTNPLLRPSSTNNLVSFALIRGFTNYFSPSNVAYIGIDEFDLTRLNNNVAMLKSYYGI